MIFRWLNSLGGRITLFVVLALLIAQIIAVFALTRSTDGAQSAVRTEGMIRQMADAVELFNELPNVNRANYLARQESPGNVFWMSRESAIDKSTPPTPEWPGLPDNWNDVVARDKRFQWFPDRRPVLMRLSLAPYPTQENLRDEFEDNPPRREFGGPGRGPRPRDGRRGPLGGPLGDPPPRGAGEGGRAFGPPPPPPEGADTAVFPAPPRNRPPPLRNRPPPRWRFSAQLEDGAWVNAELMYERGLPPWLRTVLMQSGVILVLTIFFVVPGVVFATRRLSQLAEAADRLGRGEETEPLPESGTTEIKRLTQAFNSMSLRLRRFVQGRTQMLAGISHDLRTPITALRLRTDLVDDEENRDRMQHLIDDLHHLTESTLALAKDESFTEKSDKVDVSSLIDGICDDLTDAGLAVTSEVQRGVTLVCRPYSLRRAIRNIAENGVKYGKCAKIYVTDDERNVRIIVEDEGPGIPAEQVEKAFQPFVRLEGSRSRETGGSGLGLAITRSIILNHGGDIALSNRPEGGLRVVVTVPKAVVS